MTCVRNPILPGFNPDPSICRVGDDFYIATSTFEWFPGVQIWHSQNLVDWHLLTRPLHEDRLLNLIGIQSSGGIWAPCLSYHDGLWYLVYTVVKTWRGETPVDMGAFKDTLNYLTTSPSIEGPWSDPVYLNASGFDPSLFHEENRSWLLNMQWSHRGDPTHFTGILLQEYHRPTQTLTGEVQKIFSGTEIGYTEGPHLYLRNGWYYLMTAEGGTSYAHAVTIARSRTITGPYEVHPRNPLLQSLENRAEDLDLIQAFRPGKQNRYPSGFFHRPQRAGHASFCMLSEKEWALVHLSGRPLPGSYSSTRGRETSIQRVIWEEDDWPYVVDREGKKNALAESEVAFTWKAGREQDNFSRARKTEFSFTEDFTGTHINSHFRYLRRNPGADMVQDGEKGCLYLHGRESMISTFLQTYVAVSVPFSSYTVETSLDFDPCYAQEMAGLLVHYDERNQYYLRIRYDEGLGQKVLGIMQLVNGKLHLPSPPESVLTSGRVALRLVVNELFGRFSWKQEGDWQELPGALDMGQLADERVWPEGFTGTFVGMACHDQTGGRKRATFHSFSFQEA